jgi:hypothetical protein
VVLPASMWAMIPMLRTLARSSEVVAIRLQSSLGLDVGSDYQR